MMETQSVETAVVIIAKLNKILPALDSQAYARLTSTSI